MRLRKFCEPHLSNAHNFTTKSANANQRTGIPKSRFPVRGDSPDRSASPVRLFQGGSFEEREQARAVAFAAPRTVHTYRIAVGEEYPFPPLCSFPAKCSVRCTVQEVYVVVAMDPYFKNPFLLFFLLLCSSTLAREKKHDPSWRTS